jgi:GNAT superfamily N-acetyltransferase
MLTASVETFRENIEDFKQLSVSHYDEISEHKLRGIPLNPQYEVYLQREDAGTVIFIALRNAGKFVGYLISFVTPGLHYADCLTSVGDIFFVYPAERGKFGGVMLFKAWEAECRRRGVKLMCAGIKVKHADEAKRLMEIMQFFEAEIMFWKFLEDTN